MESLCLVLSLLAEHLGPDKKIAELKKLRHILLGFIINK
ncbi:hypothetical protein N824_01370 [Pedobacter sp. V48]|nr:hypothetical protein N824_01370 [Pedobacter sp. V48]